MEWNSKPKPPWTLDLNNILSAVVQQSFRGLNRKNGIFSPNPEGRSTSQILHLLSFQWGLWGQMRGMEPQAKTMEAKVRLARPERERNQSPNCGGLSIPRIFYLLVYYTNDVVEWRQTKRKESPRAQTQVDSWPSKIFSTLNATMSGQMRQEQKKDERRPSGPNRRIWWQAKATV